MAGYHSKDIPPDQERAGPWEEIRTGENYSKCDGTRLVENILTRCDLEHSHRLINKLIKNCGRHGLQDCTHEQDIRNVPWIRRLKPTGDVMRAIAAAEVSRAAGGGSGSHSGAQAFVHACEDWLLTHKELPEGLQRLVNLVPALHGVELGLFTQEAVVDDDCPF